MHIKLIYMPATFIARKISCIQIELCFILANAKLHSGAIMAFINIFVDILDSFDESNRLHINMAAIFPQQPWTV